MASIPVLFGYIQQLQQTKTTISSDFLQLASDFNQLTLNTAPANLVLIALTVILIWCCLGWLFDSIKAELEQQNQINAGYDPEEFDYLSSSEAIPAKFNLIDAYIQMQDFESANNVLTEIIKQGNAEQRAKALSILDEIN